MLEKSKYNLVDDSIEPRIPADNEGQFQHGLSFEVKFIGSLDIVRPKSRIEILAAMRQIRNTKEDMLKKVGNRTALDPKLLLYGHKTNASEWGRVNNILQNIFFCALQKKESHTGLNDKRYEFKVKNIKKKKVNLMVSVDGVRVVLRRKKKKYGYSWDDSQVTLAQDPIFRIFYVSHDSQDLKIFSYIARDKKSNVFRCNVFKSKKKSQAMKIVRTVGQAFEVCHKQSLDNADAWLVKGEEERSKEEPSASSSSSENSICLETNEKRTKEDILKKVGYQTALGPIHFCCLDTKPMQVNGGQFTTFFKIPSFVFCGRKKVIQVSNDKRVCEDPILVMETLSHPLMVNHQVQLLERQLQQQEQRSQAASAQVSLLQQQLSGETSARTEAQTRVQQLLQQNAELLQHLSLLVKHIQELELRTQAHKRSPLGSQDSLLEIALRANMPAVPRDFSPNPPPPPSGGFPLSASQIGLDGFCFFTEPSDKEKKKTEQDRDSGQGHDEEQSGNCSPPGIQFLSALETPGFRESGIASGYESNTDESDDRDSCGQ